MLNSKEFLLAMQQCSRERPGSNQNDGSAETALAAPAAHAHDVDDARRAWSVLRRLSKRYSRDSG